MNTNMSSANQSNNGGNIVINNAALQLLIASKNEAQRAEFEAETGWTWQAACAGATRCSLPATAAAPGTASIWPRSSWYG